MPQKRRALQLKLSLLMLSFVALAACGSLKPAQSRAANGSRAVHRVTVTIRINSEIGDTFAPPPVAASPKLTAQQAWAAYTKVNRSYRTSVIPSNMTVHIGLFTLPLGPSGPGGAEAYAVHNQLVYGFSWHRCPISTNPRVKKLPPNPCIEWNFLSANTGRQLLQTWQM